MKPRVWSYVYKELSDLWFKAGMQTHKWLFNSPVVMEGIPQRDTASKLQLDDGSFFSTKVLGISWIASEDNFTFDSKFFLL